MMIRLASWNAIESLDREPWTLGGHVLTTERRELTAQTMLTRAQYDRLRRRADQDGRSVSSYIARHLRDVIDEDDVTLTRPNPFQAGELVVTTHRNGEDY